MSNIYEKSIEKWGEISSITVCMEECAELIHACSKLIRAMNRGDVEHAVTKGKSVLENLAHEIADVEIALEEIKIIAKNHEIVEEAKKQKFERIERRLKEPIFR